MFHIRNASIQDVSQIASIHINSWAEAYQGLMPQIFIEGYTQARREKLWRKIIDEGLAKVLVAEVLTCEVEKTANLLGFLSYGSVEGVSGRVDEVFELNSLYVLPEYHSQGVGSGLYGAFELALKDIFFNGVIHINLWVLDNNLRALNFYRKLGFCETGKQLKEKVCDVYLTDLELVKSLTK